jgi:membrane protein required for beta-lactamase induction
MSLIGILLALLAQRAFGDHPRVGEPMLLEKLVVQVQKSVKLPGYWRSAAAPVVLLVLATVILALMDWWLSAPLADLALKAVVLFLCLGPRNLSSDVHKLIEAREANDEAAERRLTRVLLRGPGRHASRRALIGTLFIQSHERMFGVLLWFIAAGPAGAVFYRLASRMPRFLHETQPDTPAERMAINLHAAAAWIPAHLSALLFGLAGSLDRAIAEWRRQFSDREGNWRDRTWALLAEASAASLAVDEGEAGAVVPATLQECLREVLAMQTRAMLILLAGFGLFTAGGWIS